MLLLPLWSMAQGPIGLNPCRENPGATAWYRDADGDGIGNSANVQCAVSRPSGYVATGGDCNDSNPNITGVKTWYRDADGDGYGNANDSRTFCTQPSGYVSNSLDCNDSNASITISRKYYRDADGDGYGKNSDTLTRCSRPSGYSPQGGDCNDSNANIHPGAAEPCDGVDNDCDNQVDENTPTIPSAVTVVENCGNAVLTRSSSPVGTKYYWQSSATGTSTANSATSITRTSGNVYYLRARHNNTGCWSTARAVVYGIKTIPSTPPVPTVTKNCGNTVLTRASFPSGITYYWQTSASGTSRSSSATSVTRTSGTRYYLRARNNSSGCWSTARTINYSIHTVPSTPPTVSVNNQCGQSVLTRSNPPSGITYYWQSSATGTSSANSTNSITRTSGTTYYLRARNNSSGCWSTTRTINYSIHTVPSTPPTASVNNQCGQSVLTRSNPPSGVTYYWQNSASGTSTASTNTTITRTSGSTYYLRARNNSSGCWSAARIVSYNVKSIPAIPSGIIVDVQCDQTLLTRTAPPSGVTYYWQSTANGISTASTNTTITRTSGSAYYLRARNNSSGCWSAAKAINYTLNHSTTWYADIDADGFGDANTSIQACEQPTGYVANATDQCPNVAGSLQGCIPDQYVFPSLSNENYIYNRTYQSARQEPINETVNNATNSELIETVAYFDGLGRAKQQTAIKASPEKKDVVTHIAYDAFGRQAKQYLPFESQTPNGSYATVSIEQDIQHYYQNKYPADFTGMAVSEVNAYSESIFEPSPLNRVLKQAAPGKTWKASEDPINTDRTIKSAWETNNAADAIVNFSVVYNADQQPRLVQQEVYEAGTLRKTITKDENWEALRGKDHTTEEYTNSIGQVVLKRTYNNQIAHDTYYVYDDYGLLSYVVPPKVTTADDVNQSELSELCYQYKYDYRNRLIEKKIPGKGWETIVYNKLDQPVLTQDANLKAQGVWLFTKYDALGRVVYTGKINDSRDRAALQTVVNQSTTLWEARTTVQQVDGFSFYYTQNAFPTTGMTLLTINYYDDYALGSIPPLDPETTDLTWEGMTATTAVKGLLTVGQVRVLDTDKWITTTNYYDEKGRLWDNLVKNEYLGTDTWTLTQLDFVGKPLKTFTKHIKDGKILCTTDVFTYDHMGRLLTQEQQINELPTERILNNHYDELGQLIRKDVGGKTTATAALQSVDYSYNVRGWLKQINDTQNLGTDLFGFRLNYDTPEQGATALFNGNISETHWKTANDNTLRHYTYSYDALNRITRALSSSRNYCLSTVAYDKNGNITKLVRRGAINESATSFNSMDNLTYHYDYGNKLLKVDEINTKYFGFTSIYNGNSNHYAYDQNGNMTIDRNKGITNISYNHLNLPTGVSIANTKHNGNITYVYDATGIKQKKIATEGSNSTITEYSGNYIYKNGTLEFFNHPEGYIEPKGDETFDYIYQYKDHLGNIRLSYQDLDNNGTIDQHTEIKEEKHYYPFGMVQKGYNNTIVGRDHQYGFQEQEEQNELGLNWIQFKWRNHDPAIGRFMTIDPLTEEYMDWGAYVFSGNRVIDARELEGLEPHSVHKTLDGAAKNFGEQYNGISIRASREVGTRFYSTTTNGVTTYSYTTPTMGTEGFVDPNDSEAVPDGSVQVGDGHTHGSDGNNEPFGMDENEAIQYGDNFPSDNDIDESDSSASTNSSFEADYTVTPNGTLLKYTPTGKTGDNRRSDVKKVNGASKTIPSDTNSNTRKNNISPNVTPEVLPNNVDKDDFPKQ